MVNGAVTNDRKPVPPRMAKFSRHQKLTKAAEFKRVFDKPFVSSDPCFKVLARPNQRCQPRLGLAVSRQIDKRAVGRNRIKRIARESFRLHFAHSGAGLDVVILPRRETTTMCNEKLFESLNRHWSRLERQFEG